MSPDTLEDFVARARKEIEQNDDVKSVLGTIVALLCVLLKHEAEKQAETRNR